MKLWERIRESERVLSKTIKVHNRDNHKTKMLINIVANYIGDPPQIHIISQTAGGAGSDQHMRFSIVDWPKVRDAIDELYEAKE